jgi:hypothetical protein
MLMKGIMKIESEIAQRIARHLPTARAWAERRIRLETELFEACESPIEQKFLDACLELFPGYADKRKNRIFWVCSEPDGCWHGKPFRLHIFPQVRLSLPTDPSETNLRSLRLDFLFLLSVGVSQYALARGEMDKSRFPVLRLNVEVDGHEFHERTKEQAERDRSRDRLLTAVGFKVFRFTGSELFKSSETKAEEIFHLIRGETKRRIHEWRLKFLPDDYSTLTREPFLEKYLEV